MDDTLPHSFQYDADVVANSEFVIELWAWSCGLNICK